jgi:hypothetical protein
MKIKLEIKIGIIYMVSVKPRIIRFEDECEIKIKVQLELLSCIHLLIIRASQG